MTKGNMSNIGDIFQKKTDNDDLLRSELFGVDQMQKYGRILAETHILDRKLCHRDRLLARLVDNEKILDDVKVILNEAISNNQRIAPAADWLLDNYYLIEDHIRTSKRDLPKGYSRELPRLGNSDPAGLPRVYDIALQRISHCDGLVDPETLPGFLKEYQSVSILTLGELWAIPIMFRLALIENLRRIASRIATEMIIQDKAVFWSDRMIETAVADPKSVILLVADMARSDQPLVGSFVAEMVRKLQGKGPALGLPLTWIEQRLGEAGLTIERLIQLEMNQQAADQVSVSNTIRSLRSLGAKDWKDFVESTSPVEMKLREDPAQFYSIMEFETRDRYRHVIEELSRMASIPEITVASRAIQLANDYQIIAGSDNRESHVGYYLIDKGLTILKQAVAARRTPAHLYRKAESVLSLQLYIGSILLGGALITAVFMAIGKHSLASELIILYSIIPCFIAAIGFSSTLINWIVTLLVVPHQLPRLDYSAGIPPESTTLVVIPSMLATLPEVEVLADNLEVRFLANREDNLFFGLLTDFPDADEEITANDAELLQYARKRIDNLNFKYHKPGDNHFFLFHRSRKWNEAERKWMGHERKRGKIADLNELVINGKRALFDLIIGSIASLASVKYILTLDTDTLLPRDSARRLAGTMAHPLNRARYDVNARRIIDGYGILQPRVATSLSGENRSMYGILHYSEEGIDPYTRVSSDVYQDLFGEGSYIGKGIYDVNVFSEVLKDRFPENQILSHDLLEGCYARSGLVSDIQLFEKTPSTYSEDVQRRKRWLRGDWQLIRWLFPGTPFNEEGNHGNPLSVISRWKILDNLRRSVSDTALIALFVLGWTTITDPVNWTLAVLGIVFIPSLVVSMRGYFFKPVILKTIPHLANKLRASMIHIGKTLFSLVCLPYEAYISLSAIGITLWRMTVTHRHLLEWKPSDQYEHSACKTALSSYLTMWIAPAFSLATSIVLLIFRHAALPAALPLLCLWTMSPLIVWYISKKQTDTIESLSDDQSTFLRRISRKTWAFFETFVNEKENWLPPDNYQEIPSRKIAHRTSPTNIGLSLLANATARDFGYISTKNLIERTSAAIHTIERLEKHRNHLFNWYDTITLEPLIPRYISTVDSGNLAASLMTLSAVLAEIVDSRVSGPEMWQGIQDTCLVIEDLLENNVVSAFIIFKNDLESARHSGEQDLHEVWTHLKILARSARSLRTYVTNTEEMHLKWWTETLERQCHDQLDDLEYLVPWISLNCPFGTENEFRQISGASTLRELSILVRQSLGEKKSIATDQTLLMEKGQENIDARLLMIQQLIGRVESLLAMDFTFLYDTTRRLLSIGYMLDARRRDPGFYDLLASEARLTSFVAIALGQIPQENWFALGRLLIDSSGDSILASWSGSMFEYLMPLLVMPTHTETLLGRTCQTAVACQIEYGRIRGVPWGISESGYNSFDIALNYQYRAFGIPTLGLKRGLLDDLVIAPYASALALMIMPLKACQNLHRLSKSGIEGDYGFYEAIDFTKSRVPTGYKSSLVRSFMAHHQGMSFISFSSYFHGQKMQKRFESIPAIRATVLLLDEKIPQSGIINAKKIDTDDLNIRNTSPKPVARIIPTYNTPTPEVQILSNGNYHVMVTNAGGGYSRWKELSLTRWQEDKTSDNRGSFLYIRDIRSGLIWSNTYQPTLKKPDNYEVVFSEGRAEFRRRDNGFDTYTEIVVSPEDDIELRRIRITNRSRNQRTIEVTSFSEVVLATAGSEAEHPCFSGLFMQTEIINDSQTILFRRRPRSPEDSYPVMLHLMIVHDAEVTAVSYETDRLKFIGRGNTTRAPGALAEEGPLSGTQGSVLDPVAAIRQRIVIEGDASATIDIVTGIGDSRDTALLLAEKYHAKRLANRAFELARTHSQILLKQINGTEADAHLYSRMANSILYADEHMRTDTVNALENRRGQSGLWGYSISGDLPIVLLMIKDPGNINLARQMVQAHAYWHQKGLEVDLVIWNEDHTSYRQQLQEQIIAYITAETNVSTKPGGIFVRSADQISNEDRILIQTAARVVISDVKGSLKQQIDRKAMPGKTMPRLIPHLIPHLIPLLPLSGRTPRSIASKPAATVDNLLFNNGIGGYSPDGREYVITTSSKHITPMPWVNVLANARFGTVVSESGMAYTWGENSHDFRLTPWYNDPVSDVSGEALYIRDDESGDFWSPSPLPKRGSEPYTTRHGFGYSTFEHTEYEIASELCVYVALDAPVKFIRLKMRNNSGRIRKLSVFTYSELVLGDQRQKNAMHIVTEVDKACGALFARNRYNTAFEGRTVFLDVNGEGKTITADRTEFLGRNGNIGNPDAMTRIGLSGTSGPELDPCLAAHIPVRLMVGQEFETTILLGAGKNTDEAISLVHLYRIPGVALKELESVKQFWSKTLSAIRIQTPDVSLNLLANGWLVYQIISSRMWGRTGFYQSGGAFGFRDQLQDAMALVHIDPSLVQKHLLLCASRQFKEGDVQHWWHPPLGQGTRTRCSDDYLWLPLATSRYIAITGDVRLLDEKVPFLEGAPLNAGEESSYSMPTRSTDTASLYDHCVRAIEHSAARGVHGLPLMEAGDWNDGMNMVGYKGQGESVWLAFFLYAVLTSFSETARLHGDARFAEKCLMDATVLKSATETAGWDGQWYIRAWFDDGEPLGSSVNQECKIDSIAQSWSVLSGAGEPTHSLLAMKSLNTMLVRREQGLIQLLDPPFDSSERNPGYIKGYVPGIRENGGQYTHAAIWAAMAFTHLKDATTAWDLVNIINPIRHGDSPEKIAKYKADPYVMSADVYSVSPHSGRGGWTWYTGSAGWMYRLITESLLGLTIEGATARVLPCIPDDWKEFKMHYRYLDTIYQINVSRISTNTMEGNNSERVIVDGQEQNDSLIHLADDHVEHNVEIWIAGKG